MICKKSVFIQRTIGVLQRRDTVRFEDFDKVEDEKEWGQKEDMTQ